MIEKSVTRPTTEEKGLQRKIFSYRQWMVALLVNVTLLSYGLHIGWIACVANTLLSHKSPLGFPFTEVDISWLASCPNLAAMTSIPVWTFLVDRFGRKPCILYCAWIQVVGWLLLIPARNMPTLLIARVTGGVGGGGCVYIMPLYIKEISQDDQRGALGLTSSVLRILGILVVYAMTNVEYYTILWIMLVVSIAAVAAVYKAPESPTYYVKIGKTDEAASTIAYLRMLPANDKVVENVVQSIKAEDQKYKSIPNISFFGIFKQKSWRKGFIFMMLVMMISSVNGGLSIINYAPIILNVSRITVDIKLQTLSIPVFMITGALLSMMLIDKLGRKPILAASFLLSTLSFAAVAAILLLQQSGTEAPAWLAVLVTVVPVCVYSGGVSPVPIVIAAEMFNFHIRAVLIGCLAMVSWGGAYIQLLIFAPMSNCFGPHVTFIFFAVINLLGTVATLVLLPETKGKSVEEIELELEKRLER